MKKIFFDTFENKADADYWIDNHILEHLDQGYFIREARVLYVGGGWSASVLFDSEQMEMALDEG